jgi:Heavy-metal resistance protein CzcE
MKTRFIGVAAAALAASMVAAAAVPTSLLGGEAMPEEAVRTIVITPDLKYVNVTEGDIVAFVANGKTFAWNFDGPSVSAFDLNRVAPEGMLDHTVTAYVAPNTEEGSD